MMYAFSETGSSITVQTSCKELFQDINQPAIIVAIKHWTIIRKSLTPSTHTTSQSYLAVPVRKFKEYQLPSLEANEEA